MVVFPACVWYCKSGIANILSLSSVKKRYKVTFDSSVHNTFMVHKIDGTTRIFRKSDRGLYYMDTMDTKVLKSPVLINTVTNNKTNIPSLIIRAHY